MSWWMVVIWLICRFDYNMLIEHAYAYEDDLCIYVPKGVLQRYDTPNMQEYALGKS